VSDEVMRGALETIVGGGCLDVEAARAVMDLIMEGSATSAQIGGLLAALRTRGETVDELAGMVMSMRDHATQERRKFVRFFAEEEDLSHDSPDAPLPDAVVGGSEPFIVVGAMAGG